MTRAAATKAGNCSIPEFATAMGHSLSMLTLRMKIDRVLQELGRPYSEPINRGYFDVRDIGEGRFNVELTGKGQVWLARKYPAGFDMLGGA